MKHECIITSIMSGHSKWANIKRKKELNDKKKSNVFGKMARLITMAVITGGGVGDPEHNIRLKLAIDQAHATNFPKENIARAIEKGLGPEKNILKEVTYEAFGIAGVAIIILATTDNPNRTLSEIRTVLDRGGGKLGNQGSVTYLFRKCDSVIIPKKSDIENKVFLLAEQLRAFDISEGDHDYTIFFPYEELGRGRDLLKELSAENPEIDYLPTNWISLPKPEDNKRLITLLSSLEELEDVHKVFVNAVISDI